MLRFRMKSAYSFRKRVPYLREHIDSRGGFSGLIERVTLGNSAPGNRVGEGRVGDRPRASFVRAAILDENPLADVIASKESQPRIKSDQLRVDRRGYCRFPHRISW